VHPYSSKAFYRNKDHDMKHCGLGDLNVPKQNKLPSLINKYEIILVAKWSFCTCIKHSEEFPSVF